MIYIYVEQIYNFTATRVEIWAGIREHKIGKVEAKLKQIKTEPKY